MKTKNILLSLSIVLILAMQTSISLQLLNQPASSGEGITGHSMKAREYFEMTLTIPEVNMWEGRSQELLQSDWNYVSYNPNSGAYTYLQNVGNLWTDVGMNRTQHKLFNPADDNGALWAQYISVHTSLAAGTCAFTSTTLGSEVATAGLSRTAGTFAAGTFTSGDVQVNQTNSFSVTGTVNNINATGLWDSAATGLLFACGEFAPTSVVNGDTLQIRHVSDLTQA